MKFLNSCQSVKFGSGIFLILLFFGALFWAKEQDPFSRKWFTLKTADHNSFKCVTVLPKPMRQYPVVIYAHGSGGTLMNDGNDLRQMAELGLAAVSLEYNQTNEAAFIGQFESLLNYLSRQKWVNTNAIAWVGFSLGANRMLDFALQHPERQPQLLVQLSGAGISQYALNSRRRGDESQISSNFKNTSEAPYVASYILNGLTNLHCPILLVHGEQDEIFPVTDTKQLASVLQTNSLPVELKILSNASHGMEPDRGVVFRAIGEYCLTHLAGKDAWQNYHSIAQWQDEAPPLWLFWLPAVVVAASVFACRRAGASRPAGIPFAQQRNKATKATHLNFVSSLLGCLNPFARLFRAAGRQPSKSGGTPDATPLKWHEILLRWLAVILAMWALAETAIHLVTPHFVVSDKTLSIARRFLVQPKERPDFEYLAAQPIWHDQKLKTLLTHVELAGYNRELINWQLDDKIYQDYVLSPAIGPSSTFQPSAFSLQPLQWRRPLWEEFYPHIRHEASPDDAAGIVVRHLRERVTIAPLPNLPHDVPTIWLRQITDEAGFEIIYVAALRSVGVPAKLDMQQRAEFWDGGKWRTAPLPPVVSW